MSEAHFFWQLLEGSGARIVFVNPLQGFLPAGTNINSAEHTRPILDRCTQIAEELDCTVAIVRHFAKATDGRTAMSRGLGSIDISGSARVVISVAEHPDFPAQKGVDFCKVAAVVQTKNNLGPQAAALAFELKMDKFRWMETRDIEANELAGIPINPLHQSDPVEMKDADGLIKAKLRGTGRVEAREMLEEGRRQGMSESTLRRAAARLGVKKEFEKNERGIITKSWWVKGD